MNATFQTEAGNPENQDRGAIIAHGWVHVLVVADGAGGLRGGTEAAEMAVEFIRLHAGQLSNCGSCASILQKMDQSIAHAPGAGETTCALAVVSDSEVFGASVGDSGIWLISEGSLTDLTKNQSRKPLIGSGSASPFPFAGRKVSRELLLLATDGLLKYTSADRLIAACRQWAGQPPPPRLIDLVRYSSGSLPDDVTFILAKL